MCLRWGCCIVQNLEENVWHGSSEVIVAEVTSEDNFSTEQRNQLDWGLH